MLHRLAPDAHAVPSLIHSDLHSFQNRFMYPARHTPLLAGRALVHLPVPFLDLWRPTERLLLSFYDTLPFYNGS